MGIEIVGNSARNKGAAGAELPGADVSRCVSRAGAAIDRIRQTPGGYSAYALACLYQQAHALMTAAECMAAELENFSGTPTDGSEAWE